MGVFSLWASVRKMLIYNVKEISILKSLISQLNMKKLGFFHLVMKPIITFRIMWHRPVQGIQKGNGLFEVPQK